MCFNFNHVFYCLLFLGVSKVGFKTFIFASTPSSGPKMSWEDPMSYPAIKGLSRLSNLTLVNFNTACSPDSRNYVMMTSPKYGDIFHPVEFSKISMVNVADENKVQETLPGNSNFQYSFNNARVS